MKTKCIYPTFIWAILSIGCSLQAQTDLEVIFHTNTTPIWDYTFLRNTTKEFLETAKGIEQSLLGFKDRLADQKEKNLILRQAINMAELNQEIAKIGVDYADQALDITRKNADIAFMRLLQKTEQLEDGASTFEFMKKKHEEIASNGFWKAVAIGGSIIAGGVVTVLSAGSAAAAVSAGIGAVIGATTATSSSVLAQRDVEDRDAITERQTLDQLRQTAREIKELEELSNLSSKQIELDSIAYEKATKQYGAAELERKQAYDRFNLYKSTQSITEDQLVQIIQSMDSILVHYLKYAVVLAKLTEKAYEAEEVVVSNHIKDAIYYTSRGTGYWIVADRILLDLNTIEFNRITKKQQKPNFTTYTLSLRNKDPFQMEELRKKGIMLFDITQFELDLAFPGTFAQTIKSIDVSVIALSEPGGIKGQLTKEGLSWKKVPAGIAGEFSMDDWFEYVQSGYRSMIFNDKDETLIFPKAQGINQTAGLLGIFEGKPVAGTYTLELPKYANNFDYNSLFDVILTINIASYYDPILKSLVETEICERAATEEFINTRELHLSMRLNQPDDWYEFRNPTIEDSMFYQRRYIPIYVQKDYIPNNHLNPKQNTLSVAFLTDTGYASIKFSVTSMAMNSGVQLFDQNGTVNPAHLDTLQLQWFTHFKPLEVKDNKNRFPKDTINLYLADSLLLSKEEKYLPNTLDRPYELWLIKIEAKDNQLISQLNNSNYFDEQKLAEIADINLFIGYRFSSNFCDFKPRKYAWMKVDQYAQDTLTRGIDGKQHVVPYLYVREGGEEKKKIQNRLTLYDWARHVDDTSFVLKEIIHKDEYADLIPFYSFLGPKTDIEEVEVKFDLKENGDQLRLYCEPAWIKMIVKKTSRDKTELRFEINQDIATKQNASGVQLKSSQKVYLFDKRPIELKFRYLKIPDNKGNAKIDVFIAQYRKNGDKEEKTYERLFEKGPIFTAWRGDFQTQFSLRIHREDFQWANDKPSFVLKALEFRDYSRF